MRERVFTLMVGLSWPLFVSDRGGETEAREGAARCDPQRREARAAGDA